VSGVDADEGGLDAFYAAAYPRLVAVVGAVAGDRSEGEEAVQEAFVRLIGRWDRVSKYDDPEAWVRKVALGFLSNRRRKVARGIRAFARHGAPGPVPGPTGDRIDLERALDRLPRAQREALVLQHLGLTVAQIADAVGAPAGTVKARLSRGRAALAPLLREETHDRV
jgi:RNA polymerase sigma-70 factor (ECF subfamily)